MRRPLLLALVLLPALAPAVPAAAQTRQDLRAAEERLLAEGRFGDCPRRPEGARTPCRRERERIIATYVRARMGEPAAQRELAAMLTEGSGPLRGDRTEACIWRHVVLAGNPGQRGETERELAATCNPLSREDRDFAQRRAALLRDEIALDAAARARRRQGNAARPSS